MEAGVLEEIAAVWREADPVVIFTSAGMSTESGLPDFRSRQGLWKQRPESLATMEAMRQTPNEFYFFYQWRIQRLWEVEPNAGHLALAALERAGRVRHIITQNVDGLHHRAGSRGISELHGTLRTISCLKCRKSYDSRQLVPVRTGWEVEYTEGRYRYGAECLCPDCRGNLRPDVVLFGETLPDVPWHEAQKWSRRAELFVVVGSSLVVSPANYLPQMAAESGAKLFILNQDPTPLDPLATWRVQAKAAETIPVVAGWLGIDQEWNVANGQ